MTTPWHPDRDPWMPTDPWVPEPLPWEPEDDTDPDEREFWEDWQPPYPPPSEYHLYKRDADRDA